MSWSPVNEKVVIFTNVSITCKCFMTRGQGFKPFLDTTWPKRNSFVESQWIFEILLSSTSPSSVPMECFHKSFLTSRKTILVDKKWRKLVSSLSKFSILLFLPYKRPEYDRMQSSWCSQNSMKQRPDLNCYLLATQIIIPKKILYWFCLDSQIFSYTATFWTTVAL